MESPGAADIDEPTVERGTASTTYDTPSSEEYDGGRRLAGVSGLSLP